MPGTALDFLSTKEASWNDFSFYIDGVKSVKCVDFEYGVKQEKEYLYGSNGGNPLSIQSGNKSYPITVSMYKGDVDILWAAAIAAGGDDVTDVAVDIQGAYRAQGARQQSVVKIVGFEITEAMYKIAQNAKSVVVQMPGLCMGCYPV